MPADPPRSVDLNADLGEEVTDDAGLLEVVTSANVACGFHAGTPATMRAVCAGAARRGVVVGAQVSYRDRAGFGRVARDVPYDVLRDEVAEQVATLDTIAREEGTAVRYLKPHGALYHRVTDDAEQAEAVLAGSGEPARPRLPGVAAPGAGRGGRASGVRRGVPRPRVPRRPARGPRRAGRSARGRRRDRGAGGRAGGRRSRRCACTATRPARSPTPTPYAGRSRTRATGWRRSSRGPEFSTASGGSLWRIGAFLWTTRARLWRTRRAAGNCRADRVPNPLRGWLPRGIELSLPTHRLRGAGAEKQEDPDRGFARGAGRWRQAGSEGLSGDRVPPRDQPEGLLMLIPSRALHLFHAPLTELAKSTRGRRLRRSARTRAKRGPSGRLETRCVDGAS